MPGVVNALWGSRCEDTPAHTGADSAGGQARLPAGPCPPLAPTEGRFPARASACGLPGRLSAGLGFVRGAHPWGDAWQRCQAVGDHPAGLLEARGEGFGNGWPASRAHPHHAGLAQGWLGGSGSQVPQGRALPELTGGRGQSRIRQKTREGSGPSRAEPSIRPHPPGSLSLGAAQTPTRPQTTPKTPGL